MKTTKLINLVEAYPFVNSLLQIPVSALTAMEILDRVEVIKKEFEKYEKVRVSKVKEYGEVVVDGYNIPMNSPNLDKYQEEIDELLNKEISFDFEPLSIDIFGNQKIPSGMIGSLRFLFKK